MPKNCYLILHEFFSLSIPFLGSQAGCLFVEFWWNVSLLLNWCCRTQRESQKLIRDWRNLKKNWMKIFLLDHWFGSVARWTRYDYVPFNFSLFTMASQIGVLKRCMSEYICFLFIGKSCHNIPGCNFGQEALWYRCYFCCTWPWEISCSWFINCWSYCRGVLGFSDINTFMHDGYTKIV